MSRLVTDYLIVGAGACGMAVGDELVQHSDARVVIVDRRHAPGGHWQDAYPFVRLHIPSSSYGVNSLALGSDRVDEHGRNAGLYERASAAEICAYYQRVLDDVLLPSGRVEFFGKHEYRTEAGHRLVSLLTGDSVEVEVRRKVIDATYLETSVPATHRPSFAVETGVGVMPIGDLVHLTAPAPSYVVLGAGKTGIDACLWLLDAGVEPGRIQWVKPREAWLNDRAGWQPLDQVDAFMEGMSREVEALAQATSVDDLFRRLEDCGRLQRIDPGTRPTMYRCATVSQPELAELRRITDVVRLGRVRRVGRGLLELERGTVSTDPDAVYVDCTAIGLRADPPRPVFDDGRITVQTVRTCTPTLNAAVIGYLEATRAGDEDKNWLCPPNPYPNTDVDWLRTFVAMMSAERRWSADPDLSRWLEASRLNLTRGMLDRAREPRMAEALERFGRYAKDGVAAAKRLLAEASEVPAQRAAKPVTATS